MEKTEKEINTSSSESKVKDSSFLSINEALEPPAIEKKIKGNESWDKVLASPTEGELFSPAFKDMNNKKHLHGFGVRAGVEKSKDMEEIEKRIVKLVGYMADLQDNFGIAVMKACNKTNGSDLQNVSKIETSLEELRNIMRKNEDAARMLRSEIVSSIKNTSSSNAQKVSASLNKYNSSKDNAVKTRKKALKAKAKYTRSIQDARTAVNDLKKMNSSGEKTLTEKLFNTPSKSNEKILTLINQISINENQYITSVKEENSAVQQSIQEELQALQSLEKIEKSRLEFIHRTFIQILQIILDEKVSDASQTSPKKQLPPPPVAPLSPFLFNMKRSQSASSSYQEDVPSADLMNANLPQNINKIRAQMKSSLQNKASCMQRMKVLSLLADDLASACDDFSTSSGKLQHFASGILQSEAPMLFQCWDSLLQTFKNTSNAAAELASEIREFKKARLDGLLSKFEKQVKNDFDDEELRWKHLYEAVKHESKAKSRHEQSVVDRDKAYARLTETEGSNQQQESDASSIPPPPLTGTDNGTTATSELIISSKVVAQKALGNMLSILPSGSEAAMGKMFTAKARASFAKVTYSDAELKKTKDLELLQSASNVTRILSKTYIDGANAYLLHSTTMDCDSVEEDLCDFSDKIHSFFQSFVATQKKSLLLAVEVLESCEGEKLLKDLMEWTKSVYAKKVAYYVSDSSSSTDEGFSLSMDLQDWKDLKQLQENANRNQEKQLSNQSVQSNSPQPQSLEDSSLSSNSTPLMPPSLQKLESEDHELTLSLENNAFEEEKDSTSILTDDNSSINSTISTNNKDMNEEELGKNASAWKGQSSTTINSLLSKTATNYSNEVFLSHFNEHCGKEAPSLIESFSCAYWPEKEESSSMNLPLLHGRMFLTNDSLFFIGWGDKKVILQWNDAISVSKESNMMGSIDNSLRIFFKETDGKQSSYYFGSFLFRDQCFQLISKLISEQSGKSNAVPDVPHDITAQKSSPQQSPLKNIDERQLSDAAPDEILKKMEIVVDKKLRNVSIQKFYDLCWSDEQFSLYGNWLRKKGSIDVSISDWQYFKNNKGNDCVNEWCGESYTQKRTVSFKYTRTTHLYIGPPIATVLQTQYCRVDDNDRCVLAMVVKMDGIPYADVFNVECRWVASRIGNNDLKVQAGIFVDFKKYTMLKRQIREGTIKESSPAYLDFFQDMQNTLKENCTSDESGVNDDVEETKEKNNLIDDNNNSKGGTNDNEIEHKNQKSFKGTWNNIHLSMLIQLFLVCIILTLVFFTVGRKTIFYNYFDSSSCLGSEGFECFSSNEEKVLYLSNKVDRLENEIKSLKKILEKISDNMDFLEKRI